MNETPGLRSEAGNAARRVPLLRPALRMPYGVRWGFTTRAGGVARGPVSTLTLARGADVADEELGENWARTLAAVDDRLAPDAVALVHQVHGGDVLVVDEPTGPFGVAGEADALVTTRPGLALAVRVADCVPILIGAEGGVAAVHAGWRGVAARVVHRAIEVLAAETGCRPERMVAAIGPHIGQEAFEVGPEVVEGIEAAGVVRALFAAPRGDRWHADLGAAVSAQLRACGVASVGSTNTCTTEPRFFSWRRDAGRTGRQAGVIAWWP
jgi:YfiH family protein